MNKKRGWTTKRRNRWICEVVVLALISFSPYVIIPDLRAWVVDNPLTVLLCTLQGLALACVLMLGVHLLLKWVRGEKKEEEKI